MMIQDEEGNWVKLPPARAPGTETPMQSKNVDEYGRVSITKQRGGRSSVAGAGGGALAAYLKETGVKQYAPMNPIMASAFGPVLDAKDMKLGDNSLRDRADAQALGLSTGTYNDLRTDALLNIKLMRTPKAGDIGSPEWYLNERKKAEAEAKKFDEAKIDRPYKWGEDWGRGFKDGAIFDSPRRDEGILSNVLGMQGTQAWEQSRFNQAPGMSGRFNDRPMGDRLGRPADALWVGDDPLDRNVFTQSTSAGGGPFSYGYTYTDRYATGATFHDPASDGKRDTIHMKNIKVDSGEALIPREMVYGMFGGPDKLAQIMEQYTGKKPATVMKDGGKYAAGMSPLEEVLQRNEKLRIESEMREIQKEVDKRTLDAKDASKADKAAARARLDAAKTAAKEGEALRQAVKSAPAAAVADDVATTATKVSQSKAANPLLAAASNSSTRDALNAAFSGANKVGLDDIGKGVAKTGKATIKVAGGLGTAVAAGLPIFQTGSDIGKLIEGYRADKIGGVEALGAGTESLGNTALGLLASRVVSPAVLAAAGLAGADMTRPVSTIGGLISGDKTGLQRALEASGGGSDLLDRVSSAYKATKAEVDANKPGGELPSDRQTQAQQAAPTSAPVDMSYNTIMRGLGNNTLSPEQLSKLDSSLSMQQANAMPAWYTRAPADSLTELLKLYSAGGSGAGGMKPVDQARVLDAISKFSQKTVTDDKGKVSVVEDPERVRRIGEAMQDNPALRPRNVTDVPRAVADFDRLSSIADNIRKAYTDAGHTGSRLPNIPQTIPADALPAIVDVGRAREMTLADALDRQSGVTLGDWAKGKTWFTGGNGSRVVPINAGGTEKWLPLQDVFGDNTNQGRDLPPEYQRYYR